MHVTSGWQDWQNCGKIPLRHLEIQEKKWKRIFFKRENAHNGVAFV